MTLPYFLPLLIELLNKLSLPLEEYEFHIYNYFLIMLVVED